MEAKPTDDRKSPMCLCGHSHSYHLGANRRGACTGTVRLMIIPKDAVPVRSQRASDVWLSENDAGVVVQAGYDKVQRAPSYETTFKKGMARGFFVRDCTCALRSSLHRGTLDELKEATDEYTL